MKLSVVIPAHNEEQAIGKTISDIAGEMVSHGINYEILIVDDGSSDTTAAVVRKLMAQLPQLKIVDNQKPNGFGLAVRKGLSQFDGDAVAIVMADGSDSPADIVKYYRKLEEGYECVFGSRFIKGSKVYDYPVHKLFLNRLANFFIKILFGLKYNDITNAFKCYKREVIDGVKPLFSNHFNLTVEIPLKSIIRGYRYAIVPISWTNRKEGISKLKIREMGSRYLFIVLYLFLERTLSCGDYRRKDKP